HDAMPYLDVPGFMVELRGRASVTARALEWTILAASRSDETLGALWCEIDIEKAVWTIPAARMKAAADHRVPLTERMIEILKAQPQIGTTVFSAPGHASKKL